MSPSNCLHFCSKSYFIVNKNSSSSLKVAAFSKWFIEVCQVCREEIKLLLWPASQLLDLKGFRKMSGKNNRWWVKSMCKTRSKSAVKSVSNKIKFTIQPKFKQLDNCLSFIHWICSMILFMKDSVQKLVISYSANKNKHLANTSYLWPYWSLNAPLWHRQLNFYHIDRYYGWKKKHLELESF